jgi:hypothetical protein
MFQANNQQRNYYSDAPSMIHDHLSAPKEVIPERQGYDRVAKKGHRQCADPAVYSVHRNRSRAGLHVVSGCQY